MLMSTDALLDIRLPNGEFFDDQFWRYWEDTDLCHRAGVAGYKAVVAERAVAHHVGHKSIGGGFSPVFVYYRERNKILVANKVLQPGMKLLFHSVCAPLAIGRALKNLLRRRPLVARAVMQGLSDGYRGVTGKWKHHDQAILQQVQAAAVYAQEHPSDD